MKREAKFNTVFNHWLKNVHKKTGVFELKQTTTESIPFSSVVEHQRQALVNAKWGGLVFKIPDAGFQNPFDVASWFGVPAYVAIKYPKSCEVISIDVFLEEEKRSLRKSLTWERAQKLSTYTIDI